MRIINNSARNKTVIGIGNNRAEVLYSYSTPVAIHIPNMGYFKTSKYWSKTTTRHINAFLENKECKKVSQDQLQQLINRYK